MERYEGVKFKNICLGESFEYDLRLEKLHYWVNLQAELGLAPVHSEGAYGNHSFRMVHDTFVITRTGMIPNEKFSQSDYCRVTYESIEQTFTYHGASKPSSECFLHSYIYKSFPSIQVVMHGHSLPLNRYAQDLGLPVTHKKYPYGTEELAQSAIEIMSDDVDFFILKDHGFVAVGPDIDVVGKQVLATYGKLIFLLQS